MNHPLEVQLNYIRLGLAQDKRPIGFLIGAGAPMSLKDADSNPLIPDLETLTHQVKTDATPEVTALVNNLLADIGDKCTLEDLLSYIRALTAIPGAKDVRGFGLERLRRLDEELCLAVRDKVSVKLPDDDSGYKALALWLGSVNRDVPVQLFTTNYDLLIEQALENGGVPYFDGFIGSYEPVFDLQAVEEDSLPDRWTRLWKLHGSANWRRRGEDKIWRGTPEAASSDAVLIYPSHLKYDQSRRLPYLAMIDRLRGFMRQPHAILFCIGFSFGDAHLNEVLVQSMRANDTASVKALMFQKLSEINQCTSLAKVAPNMTVLAPDGAVVGTKQGGWAPTKNPDTNEEEEATFTQGDFKEFGVLLSELVAAPKPGGDKE